MSNDKRATTDSVFMNFLREMRADINSESFNGMADRLIAEKRAMALLLGLRNNGFVVQETMDESTGYNCIIRRFTDEFLVVFRYELNCVFSEQDLVKLSDMLRLNSVSSGVIVTWLLVDGFPSIAFTNLQLTKILKDQSVNIDMKQKLKPLSDCIAEVFKKPFGFMQNIKGLQSSVMIGDKTEVKKIFDANLRESFKELKEREFKLPYKKTALKQFSDEDLKEIEDFSTSVIDQPLTTKKLGDYLQRITKE